MPSLEFLCPGWSEKDNNIMYRKIIQYTNHNHPCYKQYLINTSTIYVQFLNFLLRIELPVKLTRMNKFTILHFNNNSSFISITYKKITMFHLLRQLLIFHFYMRLIILINFLNLTQKGYWKSHLNSYLRHVQSYNDV